MLHLPSPIMNSKSSLRNLLANVYNLKEEVLGIYYLLLPLPTQRTENENWSYVSYLVIGDIFEVTSLIDP